MLEPVADRQNMEKNHPLGEKPKNPLFDTPEKIRAFAERMRVAYKADEQSRRQARIGVETKPSDLKLCR